MFILNYQMHKLKLAEIVIVLIVAVAFSISVSLAWIYGGGTGAIFILTMLLVSGGGVFLIFLYRRVIQVTDKQTIDSMREVKKSFTEIADNNYKQFEALLNLRAVMDHKEALPPMRDSAISPDFACLILDEIAAIKPNFALECGSGVSTIVIGNYFKENERGMLISLEHDEKYAIYWQNKILARGLGDFVKIIYAPLVSCEIEGKEFKWYDTSTFNESMKIDFAIIDGPPGHIQPMSRYPFFSKLRHHFAKGSKILLDDALRHDELKMVELWKEENLIDEVFYANCEKGAAIITV